VGCGAFPLFGIQAFMAFQLHSFTASQLPSCSVDLAMRFLSFKIFVLCVILPPVGYITTAYLIQRYAQEMLTEQIGNIYTGDLKPLLDGSVRLQDKIRQNIDAYLKKRKILSLGLKTDVTVVTNDGRILYPELNLDEAATDLPPPPMQVAAENLALLNGGTKVRVDARFEHNRPLSNAVLAVYVLCSVMLFYLHYKNAARKANLEERKSRDEILRLQKLGSENLNELERLKKERTGLEDELKGLQTTLQKQRSEADAYETELFEEMETLENKLRENIASQDFQKAEMEALREKILEQEKSLAKLGKQKSRASESLEKRFKTLYKRLLINQRAINGLAELNEELRIKAEEVIHQLDQDSSMVAVKRKVFIGKGQKTVFEVVFGYRGRLYFRKLPSKQIEVLAIGTKNTQQKELEFISSL